MAIYHCAVKIISRGSGRSSVGAAAYRANEKLYNERDNTTHDYINRRGAVAAAAYRSGNQLQDGYNDKVIDFTSKNGIAYSEIMLPENAPESYRDRQTLWNAVEQAEKQKNSQLAREVEIALPNNLDINQHIPLVQDYVKRNFVDRGMCADFSIHWGHKHTEKADELSKYDDEINKDNPHVHIMLTMRPFNNDGSWGDKAHKEYILDRRGNRIKLKSGEWKNRKINTTDWDKTETLVKWREDWARTVNKEFERLGIDERIDHRTLKAQGIDREPTIHIGVAAKEMEQRGLTSQRGQENREILQRNGELYLIDRGLETLERERRRIVSEKTERAPAKTPNRENTATLKQMTAGQALYNSAEWRLRREDERVGRERPQRNFERPNRDRIQREQERGIARER